MIKEILGVFERYQALGFLAALVVALKVDTFIRGFVEFLFMPMLGLVFGSDWRRIGVTLGGAYFGVGPFLATMIELGIAVILVVWVSKPRTSSS